MTATPSAEGLDSGHKSRYSESGKSPSMTAMTHRRPGEVSPRAFAFSAEGLSYTQTAEEENRGQGSSGW